MPVLIIGPPCSGKSTYGVEASKQLGIPYISSGDLLREAIREGAIDSDWATKGEMGPEDTVRQLVLHALSGLEDFILDGFPRTADQWRWLVATDALTKSGVTTIAVMLGLDLDKDTLLQRAERRGRADDRRENFERRYQSYTEQTGPLIKTLRAHGVPIMPMAQEN